MLLALLLLSLFLLVLLGFYVFVGAPRSRTHATFAIFVGCLALWTIKDIALWGFYAREGSAAWWASISFIIALLLQYSLVIFAWVFPEDNAAVPWRRAAVLFAPGLVLVPAALAGWMWEDVRFTEGRFAIRLTLLAYVFGLYAYGVFAYGCGLLVAKYHRYRGTLWGQQLGAILWALAITGTLNTLANIALPLAGINTLLPIGSVFVLPGVFIYAYAISNFKLFSLQSALDQFRLFPIAYKVALTIAAVAVSSFLLLQIPIVWWSFASTLDSTTALEAWRRYLVFSVISALLPNLLLVWLIIRTISRPVRRLTEAAVAVAGGDYGAEVDLRSNDEVGLLAASFNELSRKIARDIESLRNLNEQFVRAEKLAAAGQLAAGVAHEVNNPLASISSLIQILQSRATTDPETTEMLRHVSTQITRITHVLRDMTNFAAAGANQIGSTEALRRAPLNIRSVVQASLHLASFDKSFKRLRISVDDTETPLVYADADALQQVFLNLLLNARDALPEDGELTIHIYHAPPRADEVGKLSEVEEVVVEIADNGSGIAPENLSRVFDPFFTTKPPGKGTGLGLAVCYRIITAHGGRISIASNQPHGTRVSVALPVQQVTLAVASSADSKASVVL